MANAPTPYNPPPLVKVLDYPALLAVVTCALVVTALLWVARRYDPTDGILTISLLIIVAFIGMSAFSVMFTVPTDEITSAVIGGLVAAFGGIIGYWLSRNSKPPD